MLFPDSSNPILPKEEVRSCILQYSLEDLEELAVWLKSLIKERKQAAQRKPIPVKKGREVVESQHQGMVTYRLEMVKCGKKKCKCNKGKLHGPYWYAYWTENNKLKSQYLGKKKVLLEEHPPKLLLETGETGAEVAVMADDRDCLTS